MPSRRGRLIGVGVDLVEIDRAASLVRRHPEGVERFLTPSEAKLLRRSRNRPLAFALLFAAKEAASKSVGQSLSGLGMFRDFIVQKRGSRLTVRWTRARRALPRASARPSSRVSQSKDVRIELFPFAWKRVAGMLAYSYRSL